MDSSRSNPDLTGQEAEFTPEEQFSGHMLCLEQHWRELGIDPDDFIKCPEHHELMFDPDNNFEPTRHNYENCQTPEGVR